MVKMVGAATTVVLAALAAYAVALVVESIPDIHRYLRIRSM